MSGSAGNAGYATLSIIPSFRGVTAMMNRELAGVMPQVGAQAGSRMGSGMSAGLSKALKLAPIALTAAAFFKAVNVARDFEAQISAVGAVSGATGSSLDSLREKALQLGADTAFSASESASAMEELVKAGVPVAGVLNGAADAAVALAAAGGVDLATAAEVAANAMNQFNLTAADMPHIADLVAGAANASAIDVKDFAYSLQMSGSVAALVGLDFEDLTLGITAMGNAGIKGSDAGTSLKTMLMRLEPQTKRARNEMKDLGIITAEGANQFFDATGHVKSMAEISGVLTKALAGQTAQQKLATLSTLFGSDAIRAAAVLTEQGAEGFKSLSTELAKITAEEVAAARLDNLNGALEQLSGSIETVAIKAGTLAIPAIRGVAEGLTGFANLVGDPPDGFFDPLVAGGKDLESAGKNVVEVLGDLVAAGRPVVEFGAKLGATGAVVTFTALADVVERTTGLLADHSAVVAVVLGGYVGLKTAVLVGDLAGAGLMVMNNAMISLSAATTAATGRVAMFSGGVRLMVANIATVPAANARMAEGFRTGAGQAKAALGGLASPVGLLKMGTMGVATGALLVGQAWSKSSAKAKQAIDEIKAKTDELSPESMRTTANALREQAMDARDATESYRGFGGALKASAEWLTPMADKGSDAIAMLDRSSSAASEAQAAYFTLITRYKEIYALVDGRPLTPEITDTAIEQAEKWVRALERAGVATAGMDSTEVATAWYELKTAAVGATPATESMSAAIKVMGDETSTATDKLDAWKNMIDSIFGAELSIFDATTKWGDSLSGLTDTLKENAWGGLDEMSEKGKANRAALSGAAQAALDLAKSYKEAGRTDEAAFMLANTRNQLIAAGKAAGVAQEDMEAYLETLGLTPEEIETAIKATADPASLAAATAELDWAARTRQALIEGTLVIGKGISLAAAEASGHRWGGIDNYAGGGIRSQAMLGKGKNMVWWDEPSTGGELYAPRNGKASQVVPYLATGAGWYGYDLVPKRRTPMALGGLMGAGPASSASSSSSGGVTFSGDIVLGANGSGRKHALDFLDQVNATTWLHPSGIGVPG